jgi:RNA polymerase sigma-70 factor (ECF subfamily)
MIDRRMSGSAEASFGRISEHEERWRSYISGMTAGDSDSLARLYDETSSIVYGFALRMLNNQADAEEVVLDVYQQVWNLRFAFDAERGTVRAWLTTLTRSRSIDRLRSTGKREKRETYIESGWEPPSVSPVPETESILQQESVLIRQALAELAPGEREAIELAFFRGLTHVEVAEALGAPLGTIKTRIRGGLRKLRDSLAAVGLTEGNL